MENFEQNKEQWNTAKQKESLALKQGSSLEVRNLANQMAYEKAKDPDIKNAAEKITAGCLKGSLVNKLFLNQEVFEKKNISTYINNVLKKNPELRLFMQKIGIWDVMNKKYEQLLPSQKLALLTLDETISRVNGKVIQVVNPIKDKTGKLDTSKFENMYISAMQEKIGNLGIDFKLSQLSNRWNIKKTLKDDYKLTEVEANKYVQYLNILEKAQKSNVQEAGSWLTLYVAWIITWVLLTTLGVVFYNKFTNAPTETIIKEKIKLWSPELIARLLSQDVPFHAEWVIEKAQFKVDPNENKALSGIKKLINMAQTRKMTMQVSGKVAVEFDFDKSTMEYDPSKHAIFVRLQSPRTIVHESSSKIVDDNTQIRQTKDFTNIPMQLQDSLLSEAKNDVQRNNMLIEQARKNTAEILKTLYKYPLEMTKNRLDSVYVEIVDANNNVIPNTYKEPPERPIVINH